MHGGTAPQVKAAIEQRKADAAAQAAIRRILDDPHAEPVADPMDHLSRLAGRIENAVDEIGARVSGLNSVGVVTAAGGEQLRAEVVLWEKLLGHLRGVLGDLIKAGYMERRAELAEREAEMLGQLVAAALDAAGVQGQVRHAAVSAARERFMVIRGGGA